MKSMFARLTLFAAIAAPMVTAAPASAQYYGYQDRYQQPAQYYGGDRGYYGDRRYQGGSRYYRTDCRRSSGTTGGVLGAVGGGLIGNVLGGGTLGTLLGAGGGALLGRHLDQRHDAEQTYRNGC